MVTLKELAKTQAKADAIDILVRNEDGTDFDDMLGYEGCTLLDVLNDSKETAFQKYLECEVKDIEVYENCDRQVLRIEVENPSAYLPIEPFYDVYLVDEKENECFWSRYETEQEAIDEAERIGWNYTDPENGKVWNVIITEGD